MKIIANRNLSLDGKHIVAGKVETVSDAEGKLAIRHGWAVEAKAAADAKKSAKADAGAGNDEANDK